MLSRDVQCKIERGMESLVFRSPGPTLVLPPFSPAGLSRESGVNRGRGCDPPRSVLQGVKFSHLVWVNTLYTMQSKQSVPLCVCSFVAARADTARAWWRDAEECLPVSSSWKRFEPLWQMFVVSATSLTLETKPLTILNRVPLRDWQLGCASSRGNAAQSKNGREGLGRRSLKKLGCLPLLKAQINKERGETRLKRKTNLVQLIKMWCPIKHII